MSEAYELDDDVFKDIIRDGISRSIARVRSSRQTRWIATVLEAGVEDVLRCYAYAGCRDRFFWERADADEFYCAWGSVDEIESGGPNRFDDVRKWTVDRRDRIDWVGTVRPSSAATLLGGFGFQEEGPTSADWKAFPAARFVLPEVIVERRAGRERWVLFARIEPEATNDSVEAVLVARFRDAVAANAPQTSLAASAETSFGMAARPESDPVPKASGQWQPGSEYIVRTDRAHAAFSEQIRAAIREIEDGNLAKVVLARSLSVDHDGELEVAAFLGRLRTLYPTCTLIAVGRARDTFVAATPEPLVRVEGRNVVTAALAGSAPRGRDPEEDRVFAEKLVASQKENEEHAHVVDAIRAVLAPRCDELEISETPRLRPLFGIQHLETSVRGRLAETGPGQKTVDILEVVEALHPTPAVCGVPVEAAKSWLRRFEGLERGWYAAPVGWLDLCGGGDFRVALRSALIRNGLGPIGESGASRALLFAGAGIVGRSEPESELAETRIKLRALLAPLTEI